MKGITIKAIKLMLSVLILGMLVASGAARDGAESYGQQSYEGHNNYGQQSYGGHNNDFGHYDWLNPGGFTYSYGGWNNYPDTYNYPYTYPNYYYTTPAVNPTYNYNPFAYNYYDPWWATNVYGWSGTTYHYSNSWSWNTYHY